MASLIYNVSGRYGWLAVNEDDDLDTVAFLTFGHHVST